MSRPQRHNDPPWFVRGVGLVLIYLVLLATATFVLTILQPGGPF